MTQYYIKYTLYMMILSDIHIMNNIYRQLNHISTVQYCLLKKKQLFF